MNGINVLVVKNGQIFSPASDLYLWSEHHVPEQADFKSSANIHPAIVPNHLQPFSELF